MAVTVETAATEDPLAFWQFQDHLVCRPQTKGRLLREAPPVYQVMNGLFMCQDESKDKSLVCSGIIWSQRFTRNPFTNCESWPSDRSDWFRSNFWYDQFFPQNWWVFFLSVEKYVLTQPFSNKSWENWEAWLPKVWEEYFLKGFGVTLRAEILGRCNFEFPAWKSLPNSTKFFLLSRTM